MRGHTLALLHQEDARVTGPTPVNDQTHTRARAHHLVAPQTAPHALRLEEGIVLHLVIHLREGGIAHHPEAPRLEGTSDLPHTIRGRRLLDAGVALLRMTRNLRLGEGLGIGLIHLDGRIRTLVRGRLIGSVLVGVRFLGVHMHCGVESLMGDCSWN